MSISSCFRYPGGKSKKAVRDQILAYLPPSTQEYREPFVGGGGIFFGLDRAKIKSAWINDKNSALIAVYKALKEFPDEFIEACRRIESPKAGEIAVSTKTATGAKYNKRLGEIFSLFAEGKSIPVPANIGNDSPVYAAMRYYFINRTVWAGRVNFQPGFESRMYYSNPTGWKIIDRDGYLESVAEHIKALNTKITIGDYNDLLTAPGENVWIYLDPPYLVDTGFNKGSKLYECGFNKDDHAKFAANCLACPHNLCISYDDLPDIRNLFSDPKFRINEHTWTYCGTTNDEKKVGKELIITNYDKPTQTPSTPKGNLFMTV
jgi:DNA adenine methylase